MIALGQQAADELLACVIIGLLGQPILRVDVVYCNPLQIACFGSWYELIVRRGGVG